MPARPSGAANMGPAAGKSVGGETLPGPVQDDFARSSAGWTMTIRGRRAGVAEGSATAIPTVSKPPAASEGLWAKQARSGQSDNGRRSDNRAYGEPPHSPQAHLATGICRIAKFENRSCRLFSALVTCVALFLCFANDNHSGMPGECGSSRVSSRRLVPAHGHCRWHRWRCKGCRPAGNGTYAYLLATQPIRL